MAIISLTMPLNPSTTGSILVTAFNPFLIYIPLFTYQMIAGEINVTLQIAVNAPNTSLYNILAASEINLKITEPNGTVSRVLPMTSDSSGNYAIRNLLSTDFPYGGNYTAQLSVLYPDTTLLLSAEQNVGVGAIL